MDAGGAIAALAMSTTSRCETGELERLALMPDEPTACAIGVDAAIVQCASAIMG